MNTGLFDQVLAHITAHPEEWDQDHWCGTSQCFGGWARDLSGKPPRKALQITDREADWLFESSRTMDDFRRFREAGGIPEGV